MPVDSLFARHGDGFSTELLQWQLNIEDGEAQASAAWFDFGAPDHKGRRNVVFRFPTDWIIPCFDDFLRLESKYDYPITDFQTQELSVTVAGRSKVCQIYAGHLVLRDRPEVAAWYQIWSPVENAVLRALDLPFRQPAP